MRRLSRIRISISPRVAAIAIVGFLLLASPSLAQDRPATRPDDRKEDARQAQQQRQRRAANRDSVANINQLFDHVRHAAQVAKATEAQQAQVDEALALANEDLLRIRPGLRGVEQSERVNTLRAFRDSIIAEVRQFLEASQHAAFDKAMQAPPPPPERRVRQREAQPPEQQPDPQAGITQRILSYWTTVESLKDLTDVQKEQLANVKQSATDNLKRLAEEQSEPDRRAQAVRQQMQSTQQSVSELLTPAQREALHQAMAPRDERRPGQEARGPADLRQMIAAIDALDLSDDQRAQVARAVSSLRNDMRSIMEEAGENRRAAREKTEARLDRFRAELGKILTNEQQQLLRDKMEPARDSDRRPGDARAGDPAAAGAMMTDSNPADTAGQAVVDEPAKSRFLDRLTAPGGLAIGEKLPDGLNVLSITNRPTSLQGQFDENKPTIILLGCASSPTFRDRVGDIPWLIQQLRNDGSRDAEVVIIYIREQYPSAEWALERNHIDGFELDQPTTSEARVEVANNLRRWGNIGGPGLKMMVDTMDDAALVALTGSTSTVGNFAFIFKPDGTLSDRQQWFDPTGILDLVEAAAK